MLGLLVVPQPSLGLPFLFARKLLHLKTFLLCCGVNSCSLAFMLGLLVVPQPSLGLPFLFGTLMTKEDIVVVSHIGLKLHFGRFLTDVFLVVAETCFGMPGLLRTQVTGKV